MRSGALALLLLASGCTALGLYPRSVDLSRESIERSLAARMPYKRTFAGLVDIELVNPRVALSPETKRLASTFDVTVRTPIGRALTGTWTLSGVPRFDAATRSVRLDAPVVDALGFEGLPAGLAGELRRVADRIARETLAEQPVYTLKPDDLRFGGAELEPIEVRVERDRIVVPLRPR